jgi:hypothetical protein
MENLHAAELRSGIDQDLPATRDWRLDFLEPQYVG